MKVLMTSIFFQLPDDFKGDDLNEALEEFIKYRKEKNLSSIKISKANCKEIKTFDDNLYNQFWGMLADKDNKEKTIHASGIYELSPDGKKWLDNDKLSDTEFRQFIRNSLPIVEKPDLNSLTDDLKKSIEKYYNANTGTLKVRTKDYDGMGGYDYEYYCGHCKKQINEKDHHCKFCGKEFIGRHEIDIWGLPSDYNDEKYLKKFQESKNLRDFDNKIIGL